MPELYLNETFGQKFKRKMDSFGRRVKRGLKSGIDWVVENPEAATLIVTVGGAAIGGGCKLAKTAIRSHNLKKEEYLKDCYIYDRSLGMYLHTKRPLNNKDYVTINERRDHGEKLSNILVDMNILD